MEGVKILFVLCLTLKTCHGAWVNEHDKYLNKKCPAGQQIVTMASVHSDHYEDRRWSYTCENYSPVGECAWHSKVNSYDQTMNFKCPGNGAICGFKATHSGNDREYDVRCCAMTQLYPTGLSCQWTGFLNNYDGYLYYGVPWHKFINGIYSTFNNHYGDRRFKVYECKRWIW